MARACLSKLNQTPRLSHHDYKLLKIRGFITGAVTNLLASEGNGLSCPFHPNVTIRVGDDAAETHAYIRAHRIVKSDGTTWEREVLIEEFKRQLDDAADGACQDCAGQSYPPST